MTNTLRALWCTGVLAAAAACLPAQATLPAGVSGSWYNPAQSGHGLSVQVLDPEHALLYWYVYDRDGNPFFLYIEGSINGQRIDGVAYAPSGMRWGSFDPQTLQKPVWGEVALDFSDCNNATLSWEANSPDFGSGSMGVVRLSSVGTLRCQLAPVSAPSLPGGLYSLVASKARPDVTTTLPGVAAVDPQGVVWATEFLSYGTGISDIPGPTFVGSWISRTLSAIPIGDDTVRVRLGNNTWAMNWGAAFPSGVETLAAEWSFGDAGATLSFASLANNSNETWTFTAEPGGLVVPLTREELARTYSVRFRGQFSTSEQTMQVNADGTICIAASQLESCRYAGRYWLPDGDDGFMDFEIADIRNPDAIHRGRGFLHAGEGGRTLVMIGDNGLHGFALHAR